MIYVAYLLVAAGVVFLSNKAAGYIDLLDKTTKLSGAFLGGIMLSAVTSLPELFTSISATLLLDKPGLCIGNVLGSDLFNLAALGLCLLVTMKAFGQATVSRMHVLVTLFVTLIFAVLLLNLAGVVNLEVGTFNVTSVLIVVLYVFAARFLAMDDSAEEGEPDDDVQHTTLTTRQILVRFALASIGIIVLSIVITYITDDIATQLNLGAGFAGALFLGIATSLPEVSSTISLVRLRNYNVAVGNIIGSNLFNLMILAVADFLYLGAGVYDFTDPQTLSLLLCGAVATPALLVLLKWKNKATMVICPVVMVAAYVVFLII